MQSRGNFAINCQILQMLPNAPIVYRVANIYGYFDYDTSPTYTKGRNLLFSPQISRQRNKQVSPAIADISTRRCFCAYRGSNARTDRDKQMGIFNSCSRLS